jgi:hypothetical protein
VSPWRVAAAAIFSRPSALAGPFERAPFSREAFRWAGVGSLGTAGLRATSSGSYT